MEVFKHDRIGSLYAVRLDRGEDVLESFGKFLRDNQIQDAVVISGIGTLDQCCMHFVTTITDPREMEFKKWENIPLEVASVSGIVANGVPHLHMVISTTESAWGGHLEPGCRTLYLCELMVMETPGFHLSREPKVSDRSDPDFAIKNLTKLE